MGNWKANLFDWSDRSADPADRTVGSSSPPEYLISINNGDTRWENLSDLGLHLLFLMRIQTINCFSWSLVRRNSLKDSSHRKRRWTSVAPLCTWMKHKAIRSFLSSLFIAVLYVWVQAVRRGVASCAAALLARTRWGLMRRDGVGTSAF